MSQEQEQERLANIAADFIKTGVTVAAQIAAIPRRKPVKVEIRSAKDDVEDARNALKQGESKEKIAKTISQSDVAKRMAKKGQDVEQYTGLVLQKAEITNATERMPSKSQKQSKTRKKTL